LNPLDGVTVVALEQAVAAPLATRHLADLGARVIKIERLGGGDFARHYDAQVLGQSSHFVWLNSLKESLALDLKHPLGREVVRRLLRKADVFIQNLAPGATDRLGLGSASLEEEFPELVICDISGFGSTGPYRDKKAYDLLIQAETGLLSVTGSDSAPAKAGIAVADIAAGMYAFSSTLAGLFRHARTGQGSRIEVSLFDALSEWMGYPYLYARYGGTAPARTGAHHATIAPYGPFQAADGKNVFIAVQNEPEWRRFCDLLGLTQVALEPRFATNALRVQNRVELHSQIEDRINRQALGSQELMQRLDDAQIANAQLRDLEDVAKHPQIVERNRYHEIGTPYGPIHALLPPFIFKGAQPVVGSVPAIGEHSERIWREVGMNEQEIAHLKEARTPSISEAR